VHVVFGERLDLFGKPMHDIAGSETVTYCGRRIAWYGATIDGTVRKPTRRAGLTACEIGTFRAPKRESPSKSSLTDRDRIYPKKLCD
jgi:hypothetical protein